MWKNCQYVLFFGVVFILTSLLLMSPCGFVIKNLTSSSRPLRARLLRLEYQRRVGEANLANMDEIRLANSDPLPPRLSNLTAEQMCMKSEECIPPFMNLETRLRVSEKYKIMNCIVQKSMSTVMTAIMCFLYNETSFRDARREIITEWHDQRFCEDNNEYNRVKTFRKELKIWEEEQKKWRFTMVTREPVERFLSGFVDKCIRKPATLTGYCNGCGQNLTCFLLKEYKRILNQVKSKELRRSFEDRHFFPQSWRCNLKYDYKNYRFIRYSGNPLGLFWLDFQEILQEQNVPKSSQEFIREQLQKGRTLHSTVHSEARKFLETRLRSSPFLLDLVVKIFYHDFKLFDYELPDL